MYIRVLFHVGLLVESFSAVLTRIGTRPAVDHPMRGKRRRSFEALVARLAPEPSLLADNFSRIHRPSRRIDKHPAAAVRDGGVVVSFPAHRRPGLVFDGAGLWIREIDRRRSLLGGWPPWQLQGSD